MHNGREADIEDAATHSSHSGQVGNLLGLTPTLTLLLCGGGDQARKGEGIKQR